MADFNQPPPPGETQAEEAEAAPAPSDYKSACRDSPWRIAARW